MDTNKSSNFDEVGIHLHCMSCNKTSCEQHQRCPVIHCKNECGLRYHQCKTTEHDLVCTKFVTSCVNSVYGCPFKMERIGMIDHLEVCPASVVHCGMNWNRYPLYSKVSIWFQSLNVIVSYVEVELGIEQLYVSHMNGYVRDLNSIPGAGGWLVMQIYITL